MANASADLPSGYWEDGSTLTGVDLRRGNLFATTGGSAGLTARGGVRPSRGNPLGVSLPGGMFVRIQPGVAAVPAAATEGAYILSVASVTDLVVTPAHATQSRIDVVGLEMVPGSPDLWRVRMLDGDPSAGTPVAKAYAVAGGVFLPLAQITVGAAATVPTVLTDRRVYTAAAGGVVPMPGLLALSKASRDAQMALLPVGTVVFDSDVDALGIVSVGRNFMPIQQDPTATTSTQTGASGSFSNTTYGAYTTANFTFTPPRSGNAYIGYWVDFQTAGAPLAITARVKVDGVPLSLSEHAWAFPGAGDVGKRWSVVWSSALPVYCEQGVSRALSLEIKSFAAQAWNINDFQWEIAQR